MQTAEKKLKKPKRTLIVVFVCDHYNNSRTCAQRLSRNG